jgi:4-hydroxybenzoate polyprenyltransferase
VFNDLLDVEGDRRHPQKCKRPIASGRLSVQSAWILLLVVGTGSLAAAWWLNTKFLIASAGYLGIMLLYSALLKNIVIADVFVVAGGFVLRAVAGVLAIERPGESLAITPWFLGCLFFGSLLIVLCKRRTELVLLDDAAHGHRPVLQMYSLPLLDQMISISASACVISYSLYAIIGPTALRANGHLMVPSILLVLFGLFRYLWLVYCRNEGGAPENLLIRDIPILTTVVLWLLLVGSVYTLPS